MCNSISVDGPLSTLGEQLRKQRLLAARALLAGPVRTLAWLVVFLVAGAGVFAGLNTMYGAVVGRVRELATLQALGYLRRAIALAVVQEAVQPAHTTLWLRPAQATTGRGTAAAPRAAATMKG